MQTDWGAYFVCHRTLTLSTHPPFLSHSLTLSLTPLPSVPRSHPPYLSLPPSPSTSHPISPSFPPSDEAAQAVEPSTLIPFKFNPNRVVMVGDPCQLPATVFSKLAKGANYDQSLFQVLYVVRVT